MTLFWEWSAKILFVLFVLALWQLYDQHQSVQRLTNENVQLEKALNEHKQLLIESESKRQALEKETIEGMLEETNKVVISGWETLLNKVEEELQKARKIIKDQTQQVLPPKTQAEPDDKDTNQEKEQTINGERT